MLRIIEAWAAGGFAVALVAGLVVGLSILAQGRDRHE